MIAIHEYVVEKTSKYRQRRISARYSTISSVLPKIGDRLPANPFNERNEAQFSSLRHLAWNIGERLESPAATGRYLSNHLFPYELRNADIEYLKPICVLMPHATSLLTCRTKEISAFITILEN